ncbi:MAG: hypothetical protein ACK5C5_09075 [Bacteroidota bacterium]
MNKRILIYWLFLFTFLSIKVVAEKTEYISIAKLVQEGKVTVKLKGLGGHYGDCIDVSLQNNTSDSVGVWIEAGRILISQKPEYQDILIVKDLYMTMHPQQKTETSIYGFCCQAHDHSPPKGALFDFGKMAPDNWIKMLRASNNGDYSISAIQNAIWCLSDGIPVASITDADPNRVQKLREIVAEIRGESAPWYMLSYEKDSVRLFSGRPERVVGKLQYYLRTDAVVTINIRSASGQVVATLVDDMPKGPGHHRFDVDLDVKRWPRGKYQIFVYTNNATVIVKNTMEL